MSAGHSIPLAFSGIRTHASVMTFSCQGAMPMPSGGHMQGVQQLDDEHMVISGSSHDAAYFIIVRWPGGIRSGGVGQVSRLVSIGEDFPMMRTTHAGGIQLCDHVLAVGTETVRGEPSSVVFYDLSDPSRPRAVGCRIERSQKTAGAVGIVRRSSDCLLAVGDWDSDSIDFYVSDGHDLLSAGCVFARVRTWNHSERDTSGWVDGNWGKYQALNLLQESHGQLYLVGFHRDPPNTGQDWADLYRLDLDAPEPRMLVKID
ncbi:MAG: hypothetical protein GX601_08400, partial [Anaerolineales bacterium]|nr:hypothetical protein [Anaerolineales bacterium]